MVRVALAALALATYFVAPARCHPIAPLVNQSIVMISSGQIAKYKPYTFFAAAAYCPENSTTTWTCGANCDANRDFKVVAAGGDGAWTQYWFVGYSPSLNSVIVSHEGTHPSSIVPLLTDASLVQKHLETTLFPGIDTTIMVHCGFADEHAKTAMQVLAAVKQSLVKFDASHVTVVGHSLVRGALALLDSVFLPLHIPSSVKVNTVVYGLPRVGNQDFANYVDAHTSLTRINNQKDVVPVIPIRVPLYGVNYHHPSGEMHIQASGEWDACLGQENESWFCSVGSVPTVLSGSIVQHSGPYDGVEISC